MVVVRNGRYILFSNLSTLAQDGLALNVVSQGENLQWGFPLMLMRTVPEHFTGLLTEEEK